MHDGPSAVSLWREFVELVWRIATVECDGGAVNSFLDADFYRFDVIRYYDVGFMAVASQSTRIQDALQGFQGHRRSGTVVRVVLRFFR